jgi:hypothetical protein
VGLDDGDGDGTAADGVLQDGEVDQSTIVCDGSRGLASLHSVTEAPSSECPTGGARLDSGLDNGSGDGIAENGTLEEGEIETTSYICNGEPGTAALIRIADEPAGTDCPQGGKAIAVGMDSNGNGVLDLPDELRETTYLCGDFDPEKVVYGDLQVRSSSDLSLIQDATRIVGTVTVLDATMDSLTLPKLHEVEGELRFNNLTSLTELSLPNLVRAGRLQVDRNGAMTSLNLSSLRYAENLSISFNGVLSTVAVSALEAVEADLNILGNEPLQTLSLPNLRWVGGAFRLAGAGSGTPSVSTLDLSVLQRVEDRLALENMNIDSLTLPELIQVGGPLLLGRLARLSSPSFPKLEDVASSTLEVYRNPLLKDLAGFSALRHAGGLIIVDNANLPACWALRLRDQLLARDGIDGSTSLTGNTGTGGCP